MGLVPEGGPTADERETYAANMRLTQTLGERLKPASVVPVLCVSQGSDCSAIHTARAWMLEQEHDPDAYVHPMAFQPKMELKATFSRVVRGQEAGPWTYCSEEE
ncbi:hypothetical protein STCU_12325 [Strigomonas culicis]|uniref:Uncharacterized protein n=1 Tax=Strigomonas culicis TaxID=28005 RepID=S9TAY7_9TRYP|nr:hypothetical protein STCU_12325 [Strigomonas culicis]|eukprot:EPY15137.1 hypothetical protein STCU_12325 [Strigomonas culicis]